MYGNANFVDAADRHIARGAHVEPFGFQRLVNYSDCIVQPAAFLTWRAFLAVGGGDESLHYAVNYHLFLKIASRCRVAYVEWSGVNKRAAGGYARLRETRQITAAFGCRGLPAHTRIEAAFLELQVAVGDERRGRPVDATRHPADGAPPRADEAAGLAQAVVPRLLARRVDRAVAPPSRPMGDRLTVSPFKSWLRLCGHCRRPSSDRSDMTNRPSTWVLAAALVIGSASGGCQSTASPGENGTRAGSAASVGGDTAQPGAADPRMNGTGSNGEQLQMHGLH